MKNQSPVFRVSKIPFKKIRQFSKRDKDYMSEQPGLLEMVKYKPHIDSFAQAIKERQQFKVNRPLLKSVVSAQYQSLGLLNDKSTLINKLESENTFTICTAHQPVLLGGPLYTIFKAISAINTASQLKINYPDSEFIPVYIMGSEDHDFDEINHVQIFHSKVIWQNNEEGPVGRMSKHSLSEVVAEVKNILGESENANYLCELIQQGLSKSDNYGQFSQYFFAHLLKGFDLLVVSMDDARLKASFTEKFKLEIFEQKSVEAVRFTQSKLESKGYSSQAFAREINVFYMGHGGRDRIVFDMGLYKIDNTAISFTEDQLLEELTSHPESFSPNVILRPIYQESILPNLCYIGGGGELAYWMERKSQFRLFNTFYPVLMRRNSAMILPKSYGKIADKFDIDYNDLLKEEAMLLKKIALKYAVVDPDFTEEKSKMEDIFSQILETTIKVEKTLEKPVLAERSKVLKSIDIIQQKLIRAIKLNQEIKLNKVSKLFQFLFPNDGLQERKLNFMQFYLSYGPSLFQVLQYHLDPFDHDMVLIIEE